MAIKIHPSFAIHAGEWLKTEIVEAHGVSINELAEAFGVSRQSISAVLNGRASLSADMAIRFEHAFGVKAETRSEEHTSELQSLMRNPYAVFCLKKKKQNKAEQ